MTSPAGDGAACNDGNTCTKNDSCTSGKCGGAAIVCDDKDPCADDVCDLSVGCTATVNTAPCDDGKPCTTGDTCLNGACADGGPKGCGDANPCTIDTCDSQTGACVYAPLKGKICNDGSKCTLSDSCDAAGQCVSGTAKDCDDSDACTVDKCDAKTGVCSHPQAPVGGGCDDGSYCTIGDTCDAKGACKAGQKVSCVDGNPCTVDGCDGKSGKCTFQAFPDGAGCDDGDLCTAGDTCAKGKCVPGKAKVCADGLACTVDTCDTLTGECAFPPLVGACDDGDACTTGDSCVGGQCIVPDAVGTFVGDGASGDTNGQGSAARSPTHADWRGRRAAQST